MNAENFLEGASARLLFLDHIAIFVIAIEVFIAVAILKVITTSLYIPHITHSLTIIIILIKALQYLQCVSSPWYFNIHQSTALRSIKRTPQSRTIICGLTKVLNSKEAFSSDILHIEWVCWSKFTSIKLKLQKPRFRISTKI